MKIITAISIAVIVSTLAFSEEQQRNPSHSAYSVVAEGQNHRTWVRVRALTNSAGDITLVTNSFVELANGLNRWDKQGKQWVQSRPELAVVSDGIAASGAGHSAIFSKNLNSPGAIRVRMPDGQWFKSHILGLAYYDLRSGTNVLIAEPKDSAPEIVGTNQVDYLDDRDRRLARNNVEQHEQQQWGMRKWHRG
jgi:hypothetical protein